MLRKATSICNVLRGICAGRQILTACRLPVHQRALSYSTTRGAKPTSADDATTQSRQTPSATEISSRLCDLDSTLADHGSTNSISASSAPSRASATQQPLQVKEGAVSSSGSKPSNKSPDYSIANEDRWHRFTRAKGATGNMCSGRSILLTGGTSGIGLAVAQRAVLEGASHVIIVTRTAPNGNNAVQKVVEATGLPDAPMSYMSHDFLKSPPEAVKNILNPLYINTLINCAGLTSNHLIIKQRREDADAVWDANYHLAFQLSKILLNKYMIKARLIQRDKSETRASEPSWCIVNVSSLLAQKGGKGSATYAATKAALIALTRVLTLESSDLSERVQGIMPPIRANAILPGYIDTPMIEGFSDARITELTAQIPSRRFGKPSEVADAIMFLLHNEYANNCILNLDGGLSAV